jgi:hypothetical protein
MSVAWLAFGLIGSHAVCDFALQSDSMAKGKNRHNRTTPPPGAKYQPSWMHWLGAHAMIHGLGVGLVTGVWWLGVLEAIAHATIDYNKCENRYGINTDQALHYACKLVWLTILIRLGWTA